MSIRTLSDDVAQALCRHTNLQVNLIRKSTVRPRQLTTIQPIVRTPSGFDTTCELGSTREMHRLHGVAQYGCVHLVFRVLLNCTPLLLTHSPGSVDRGTESSSIKNFKAPAFGCAATRTFCHGYTLNPPGRTPSGHNCPTHAVMQR